MEIQLKNVRVWVQYVIISNLA